jgi:hypothetical protein
MFWGILESDSVRFCRVVVRNGTNDVVSVTPQGWRGCLGKGVPKEDRTFDKVWETEYSSARIGADLTES